MRAAWYERNGPAREVLQVGELSDPQPAAGEVRVRIAASGLNPSDVKKRAGGQRMSGERCIPNSDGAGIVDAVGAGVDKSWVGKRVWIWNAQWQRMDGTCAEYCCLPFSQTRELPKGVDFDGAACLGIPALTAHQAVFSGGEVKGQTILVTGGAGAVGHYAIQVAKWGGAKVIATVSSADKAALARQAGADLVIDYKRDDVAARVMEFTGNAGVERVVEVDFAANLATSIRVLKVNGTIATYSSMSAPEPKIPFYPMMTRGLSIDLVHVYQMTAAERARALADMDALLGEGRLQHNIGARFPLADIAAAHEAQESGRVTGNIVIEVSQQG
ncbi:MAG: NADPH:quinone reductase [Betaproteobacteria bacterium]